MKEWINNWVYVDEPGTGNHMDRLLAAQQKGLIDRSTAAHVRVLHRDECQRKSGTCTCDPSIWIPGGFMLKSDLTLEKVQPLISPRPFKSAVAMPGIAWHS